MIVLSHRFDGRQHLKITLPMKRPRGSTEWRRVNLVIFERFADKLFQSIEDLRENSR